MYILQRSKNLTDFGKRLTIYREYREISRFALAGLVGVSREHIWRLENGFRGCSRDLVIIISQAMHLEIEQTNELLVLAGHRPMYKKGGLSENDIRG